LVWAVLIDCGWASSKAPQNEEDLVSLHRSMQTYMDREQYQQALPLAEHIVDLVQRIRPSRQAEHAASFHNLALVQKQLGQFRKSALSFKTGIKIYEKALGSQSPVLIKPLLNLGTLHYLMDDYSKSLETFRRVQHIMHRNDGVHTLDQLPVVEGISRVLVKTGRNEEADQQQKFYFAINQNNFGAKDRRMLPAMDKLGRWLKNSGQYDEALEVWQQKLELIAELDPGSELELVEPLREIASTMYLRGDCCPLEPLNRAAEIVLSDLTIDIEDKMQALLELADMNLMERQERVARQLYRQVWDMMSSKNMTDSEAHAFFDEPVLLGATNRFDVEEAYMKANNGDHSSLSSIDRPEFVEVLNVTSSTSRRDEQSRGALLIGSPLALCSNHVFGLAPNRRPDELEKYQLSLEFSVNGNGMVFDVSVAGDEVPSNLREYVKNILYITRFRPRVVDGEVVTAEGVKMSEHFFMNPLLKQHTGLTLDPEARTVYQGCLVDAVAQI
jgi:tetratricopeptide (TPR) repeat protein